MKDGKILSTLETIELKLYKDADAIIPEGILHVSEDMNKGQ